LKVGNVIGYDGPWNYEEFREFCGRYYRDVMGSSGVGRTIYRGERNLIMRVAIRLYRREEINLPSSAGNDDARESWTTKTQPPPTVSSST
jgi:hypothetical protein